MRSYEAVVVNVAHHSFDFVFAMFEPCALKLSGSSWKNIFLKQGPLALRRASTGPWQRALAMAPKKVIKILEKPSSLDQLPQQKGMSLEEKMEGFAKAKNTNVVAFLDSLSTPQRQALWQRFSAARNALKDENADQLWSDLAKGKGSDPHKKALLQCFLKLGGDLKSKKEVYMKELVSYCKVHGFLVALIALLPPVLSSTWLSCQLRPHQL